ncbi:MAG: hypothetical protein K2N78_02975, partial [Oscillospiraceae bacterium]|nr:hypothetical protein [Oscillospiraceae bacterium]
LSLPLFLLTTGMANLFGIGGASLIARCLGAGDEERTRKASAFCIWSAIAAAFLYGMIMMLFKPYILPAVGTNQDTFGFCYQYVFWTITIGAVPTVLNAALSHLVRAEGYSAQASFGVALGGGLNIVLDPVFIFGFKMEIEGAAAATMLSNLIATLYFLILIIRNRKRLHITFDPRQYTLGGKIPSEVLLVGLPSCVMNLMGVFSNIMMNRLMASYCNEAVAGIGIAKKIDMLAFALANGLSQGVLPLIGYNYSAKNFKRMKEAIRVTLILCLTVTCTAAVLLFTCAGPIVRAFIDDAETVRYGSVFQRIICITGPFTAITMVILTIFQSVGQKLKPLILSMMRKGGLDVPFMFLLNAMVGVNGIAWATPMADLCAMAAGIVLFVPFWKRLTVAEHEISSKLDSQSGK